MHSTASTGQAPAYQPAGPMLGSLAHAMQQQHGAGPTVLDAAPGKMGTAPGIAAAAGIGQRSALHAVTLELLLWEADQDQDLPRVPAGSGAAAAGTSPHTVSGRMVLCVARTLEALRHAFKVQVCHLNARAVCPGGQAHAGPRSFWCFGAWPTLPCTHLACAIRARAASLKSRAAKLSACAFIVCWLASCMYALPLVYLRACSVRLHGSAGSSFLVWLDHCKSSNPKWRTPSH